MKLEPTGIIPNNYRVLVDAGEVQCDTRALPYPTWIGTINARTRKISVWTPAAGVPRGYKRAALAMLEEALASLPVEK